MNIQNNKKQTLSQMDIISEVKNAEKERRPVNLSNSIIIDLSMITDRVKGGLNLENSEIKGSIFLGEVIISGELNLRNVTVDGSLYLGNCEIGDDLILEGATIKGAINLVGAKIKGSVNAKNLTTMGFLSLSKTEINRDVILENANIKSAQYEDLTVGGDLFLGTAIIKGALNLGKIMSEGLIDMEDVSIGSNLVLTGAKSGKGEIDTTTVKLEGKKIV
ncbi:MAG: hypothetical protein WC446_01375 [Candidatus Paceibacterota bacterium]|jgi:hypothetical protein